MTNKPGTQKVIAIDLLRCLAAMGVFYLHNHSGGMLAKYTGWSFFRYTDSFGFFYAVPLFFLISGYCIHLSNIKYVKAQSPLPLKAYYVRRFLRIYPPYLVALILALAINYLTVPDYSVGVNDFFVHLFSLQGFTVKYFNTINIVLWTISAELAFYAIYPAFYFIRVRFNLNYALLFTLFVSCLSIAFYFYKGNITLPERFCVFNLWFAWCCGAFLADKKMLNPVDLKQRKYLYFYLIILAAFICLNFIPNNLSIIFDQFNVLIWTVPMLFVLSKEGWLIKRKNWWIIRVAAAIGLSSYSLYLMHEPLIALKNFLAHKYFPPWFQPVGVVAGIFIIPVVTWYSYYYVERPFIPKKRTVNP